MAADIFTKAFTNPNGMGPWRRSVVYIRSRLWLNSAASDAMSGGRPKPPPPIISRPSIVDTGEKRAEEHLAVLCEFMVGSSLIVHPARLVRRLTPTATTSETYVIISSSQSMTTLII